MSFDVYYDQHFRIDLNKLISMLPDQIRHHMRFDSIYTIQKNSLKKQMGYTALLTEDRLVLFAVSLYHTVFIDQFFYTHYKYVYDKFQQLTMYPKFIGPCFHMCGTNMHPSYIFQDMITEEGIDRAAITFSESLPHMRKSLSDFLHEHFSEIDEDRFWRLYDYEIEDWGNYFTREFIVTGEYWF